MPRNFAYQDLRDRTFHHQNLTKADFTGSDLRGCDFSNADLTGANLTHIRTGQTARQLYNQGFLAFLSGAVAFQGIFRLIFDASGQSPEDPAWSFVLLLYAFLGAAGTLTGLSLVLPASWLNPWLSLAGSVTSCAIVGFFYAGIFAQKNPVVAAWGAVFAAAIALLWRTLPAWTLGQVITGAIAFIATLGAGFAIGIRAVALLHAQQVLPGGVLLAIALVYHWFAWRRLLQLAQHITQNPGTSFYKANLTDAILPTNLPGVDFRQATGLLWQAPKADQ